MLDIRWFTAWIIACFCFVAGYRAMRHSGFSRLDAFALSVPFFPTPLMIAIGGGNSFLYLLDFAMPLLWLRAMALWNSAHPVTHKLAIALSVAIGIMPLLVTLFYVEGRHAPLLAMINAYRVTGISALIIIASGASVAFDKQDAFHSGQFLSGFSWFAIIMGTALILQHAKLIDSNIFYQWETTLRAQGSEVTATAAAGLFRGSIGIIGMLSICAIGATRANRRRAGIVSLAGALAGFAVILISGSKTSLVLGVLLLLLALVQLLRSGHGKALYVVGFLIGLTVLGSLYVSKLPPKYVSHVLGALTGEYTSLDTFRDRQNRWQAAVQLLEEEPSILVGLGVGGADRSPSGSFAYWHSEYVALLMNGGIFSIGPYFLFLLMLAWCLWRRLRLDHVAVVFAGLCLLGGVGQAFTVVHMTPGLYFSSTSGLFAIAYGLALNRAAIGEQQLDEIPERLLAPELAF